MPQLTKERLTALLYAAHGVDNPHALAKKVGWEPKKMRDALERSRGPYFETTIELLELAGLLSPMSDLDAAKRARERSLDEAVGRLTRVAQELDQEREAHGDDPEQSERERRRG